MKRRHSVWPWLALALAVIGIDQWSKLAIVARYALGDGVVLTPYFDLLRAHNMGAAFSFLSHAGGWQRWFFTAIAVVASVVILSMLRRHAGERWMALALSLILGGAIGNLIDRVRLGYVVDFFHVHWGMHSFPIFNVADAAITVGAILLIAEEFRRWRNPSAFD